MERAGCMTTKNHTDVGKTKVPKELQKFAGPPRAFDRQAWTADSICLGLAGYLFENQFGHCGSAETGIVFALAKRNRTSPHTHTHANPTLPSGLVGWCLATSLSLAWLLLDLQMVFTSAPWSSYHSVLWGSWNIYVVFCVKNGLILKDWLGHLGFNKLF